MDLKEMVLATIADMEGNERLSESTEQLISELIEPQSVQSDLAPAFDDELLFLNNMRDRILVLFEGLKLPNNQTNEAKVDLILNFLEYLMVITKERIEAKKGGE